MDSAKNGFLCLNYGWFWLKTETKSGQTAIFVEIYNIIFLSEANLWEQNSYKFTQSHGLRFFLLSPFLLASAHFFYLTLDAKVLILPLGLRNSALAKIPSFFDCSNSVLLISSRMLSVSMISLFFFIFARNMPCLTKNILILQLTKYTERVIMKLAIC